MPRHMPVFDEEIPTTHLPIRSTATAKQPTSNLYWFALFVFASLTAFFFV